MCKNKRAPCSPDLPGRNTGRKDRIRRRRDKGNGQNNAGASGLPGARRGAPPPSGRRVLRGSLVDRNLGRAWGRPLPGRETALGRSLLPALRVDARCFPPRETQMARLKRTSAKGGRVRAGKVRTAGTGRHPSALRADPSPRPSPLEKHPSRLRPRPRGLPPSGPRRSFPQRALRAAVPSRAPGPNGARPVCRKPRAPAVRRTGLLGPSWSVDKRYHMLVGRSG